MLLKATILSVAQIELKSADNTHQSNITGWKPLRIILRNRNTEDSIFLPLHSLLSPLRLFQPTFTFVKEFKPFLKELLRPLHGWDDVIHYFVP